MSKQPNKAGPTRAQRGVLEAANHLFRVLDGAALLTGRTSRATVARQCVERGWLADSGPVVVLDGDGFTLEPERYRHGYLLTDAGRTALVIPEDT